MAATQLLVMARPAQHKCIQCCMYLHSVLLRIKTKMSLPPTDLTAKCTLTLIPHCLHNFSGCAVCGEGTDNAYLQSGPIHLSGDASVRQVLSLAQDFIHCIPCSLLAVIGK